MADQRARTQLFTNYRYALYATEVKFQSSNCLSGRFDETKQYFSHKMYGLKLEASVSYPGICVGLSRCYPGSISDLTIFVQRQDFHLQMLQKSNEELLDEDNGESWESKATCGLFLLTKATKDHTALYELSIQEKKQSLEILQSKTLNVTSEYRLIVSLLINYFGRVTALWKISRSTNK
uniref:AlNc14C45G3679 protein n=1 Tax=Albugo laibachii Nc14 TaxID=890382 RepID=F0WAF2_9STRA|nr:AlNc14C45G3679 [Albugo laibachii Nc14]|eukprot:CCA18123.1 AlNc14C45G3679 [Albugo laibachii Nc14]